VDDFLEIDRRIEEGSQCLNYRGRGKCKEDISNYEGMSPR